MIILAKEFAEIDWLQYKNQIETQLKVNKMAILNNEITLKWIKKQIRRFPKSKKSTQKADEENTK